MKESATQSATSSETRAPSPRLLSLDAYRGFTMLLLAFTAANHEWPFAIIEAYPETPWVAHVFEQFEHVAWRGLTVWDMIQPSFMFMVGVSLAYSYASRKKRGDSDRQLLWHTCYRAAVLILLGVWLRSLGADETYWTFEDVVTQIGLGYVPLFFFATQPLRRQVAACVAILVSYWALFALWPMATEEVMNDASHSAVAYFDGFWSHWNQNVGPDHYFDRWFLNLFPRSEPFTNSSGGYNTLNFVPAMVTMLFGLMAGQLLRTDRTGIKKLGLLMAWGIGLTLAGVLIDYAGICPNVKRLWTPSFALISGGLCLLILAALFAVIDVAGWRRWAWPAVLVGKNPLAMYVMTWTLVGWVLMNLRTHLGASPFLTFGDTYYPLLENLSVGLILWLICWWMDRRGIYLRI